MTTIIKTANAVLAWAGEGLSIVDATSPRSLALRYRVDEDYSRKRDQLDNGDGDISVPLRGCKVDPVHDWATLGLLTSSQ